jgi:hypothetical protein
MSYEEFEESILTIIDEVHDKLVAYVDQKHATKAELKYQLHRLSGTHFYVREHKNKFQIGYLSKHKELERYIEIAASASYNDLQEQQHIIPHWIQLTDVSRRIEMKKMQFHAFIEEWICVQPLPALKNKADGLKKIVQPLIDGEAESLIIERIGANSMSVYETEDILRVFFPSIKVRIKANRDYSLFLHLSKKQDDAQSRMGGHSQRI